MFERKKGSLSFHSKASSLKQLNVTILNVCVVRLTLAQVYYKLIWRVWCVCCNQKTKKKGSVSMYKYKLVVVWLTTHLSSHTHTHTHKSICFFPSIPHTWSKVMHCTHTHKKRGNSLKWHMATHLVAIPANLKIYPLCFLTPTQYDEFALGLKCVLPGWWLCDRHWWSCIDRKLEESTRTEIKYDFYERVIIFFFSYTCRKLAVSIDSINPL